MFLVVVAAAVVAVVVAVVVVAAAAVVVVVVAVAVVSASSTRMRRSASRLVLPEDLPAMGPVKISKSAQVRNLTAKLLPELLQPRGPWP